VKKFINILKKILYLFLVLFITAIILFSAIVNTSVDDRKLTLDQQKATLARPTLEPIADSLAAFMNDTYSCIEPTYQKAMEEWHDQHDPRYMPAYYQGDERWSGVSYAHGNTIGSNGCGLTTAAMSFEYWTREEFTPLRLRDTVGDSCTYGGLNYMLAFADFARNSLGLQASNQMWDLDFAINEAKAGHTVWCSVAGQFGAVYYGGHLVLMWLDSDGNLRINDPASHENTRVWSEQELRAQGSWCYFISVWKQF
jgi:hypothetical protein